MRTEEDISKQAFIDQLNSRIEEIVSLITDFRVTHGGSLIGSDTIDSIETIKLFYPKFKESVEKNDVYAVRKNASVISDATKELYVSLVNSGNGNIIGMGSTFKNYHNSLSLTLSNGPFQLIPLSDVKLEFQHQINEVLKEVDEKRTEINDILGEVSASAAANDYRQQAKRELTSADGLRALALLVMAWAAFILTGAISDISNSDFDWRKMSFELAVSFLLSVPAAYLARESAKHRHEHRLHLQRSLDLVAISPFLASLPDAEQHKIKGELAVKMFVGRDTKLEASDFPINSQEIILELIKRLKLPERTDGK